jgi:putative two-component system response regulator
MDADGHFNSKATVLVVDDSPENLSLMSGLLKEQYRVKVANSGEKALRILEAESLPDMILLDIVMPGLNGHEVCQQLKNNARTRDIPIIFLTAMTEAEDEKKGFELGAVDYLTKPISPTKLMVRVRNHLTLKASADFLKDKNLFLEQEVARRTREVQAIQDVTILTIASLAETRDNETGKHIRRTQIYVNMLAEKLRGNPRFADYLTERNIALLFKSAPLHDIGKVGIPDRILLKPGSLEPGEFEIMKTHTTIGRDAIQHAENQLSMTVEFLNCAKEIAYSHQEKWDGSGYPQGLSGEDIPISARLMAVADVYDSLISHRVYRPGMSHEDTVKIIRAGKGIHFDPDLVDVFLELEDEFRIIAEKYADNE